MQKDTLEFDFGHKVHNIGRSVPVIMNFDYHRALGMADLYEKDGKYFAQLVYLRHGLTPLHFDYSVGYYHHKNGIVLTCFSIVMTGSSTCKDQIKLISSEELPKALVEASAEFNNAVDNFFVPIFERIIRFFTRKKAHNGR